MSAFRFIAAEKANHPDFHPRVVGHVGRTRSGRRRARPGAPHTTGRAGPHPAVRSAFPEAAVGIGESFEAMFGPVGVGQRAGEDWGA